ncbi:uncharacterized protein LOC117603816 [Osmia lignaria lignaria]|uniref:uncharacterized protein LOC117603816 n=1 Tax=Osmia lignaria lignaria TaxID=1437193 RepID=UPI00402BE64C
MKTTKNEDFAYAMVLFKILSWPVGTWPLQTYNRFAFIRFIVTICILLLMQLTLSLEMCLNPSNAETTLDALMLIACGSLALLKVMSFRVHSEKLIFNFKSALKDYNELNEEKKRKIMRRHAYMGRVAFACVMLFSNVYAAILTALPLLLKDNEDSNITVENTLKFSVPSEHIVLLLKLPENLYFLVFLVEYIMMMFTIAGNLGSDLLFGAIVFHLCGQAEILKMQFNRLVNDNGKTTESFYLLIKRHGYLLKLSTMLNDVSSSVMVIQMIASSMLICTCGFQFLIALNIRNAVMVVKTFVILTSLMIQLFSYSYVGNYLKSQMDDIGYSLYSCSWYCLPANIAKNIIFVIQKAQVPVYLTAGRFFVINLETYMSILKTSMSYLSVLRVMIQKEDNLNNGYFLDLLEYFPKMTTTNDEDYTYAMKPLKILSWIMGVWPLEIYNVFTFIRSIFVIGILLLMILILSIEVYLDGSDAEANLDILLLTSCGFLAISKIACFRIYSAELFFNFSSAQKDYDELDDEEKRMILRRHAYLGRVALASLILSSNFGATFITILPIILKTKEEKNVTTEETVKYPIPSAHVTELVKFPENLQMIIFITEYMMMVMTSVGNLGSDGFFFGIVFHLCGQAEVLKMEFSRAVDENGKIVENFHLLLKRHIYLLKLGEMLSDTISVVLAIQLSTSCILICTCGFQFLLAVQDENIILSAKTLFVLNALMIQLFAFSYVGDYLKCQMDSIGYALYKCDWYMLPSNVAKNITFVILKAQKPVHLKAGKFFIVNLEGFMSILKTSMSYLSVLRVMINT